MSLRIIGGIFRNRPLKAPKHAMTRPTSGILRKSVFDICQPYIENARFLDLYAGSGAMGLEALSRGASHATFVDQDKQALQCIKDNIQSLKVEDKTEVIKSDVLAALKHLRGPFDLIYVDPPYALTAPVLDILKWADEHDLLASGGILFIEGSHPSHLKPSENAWQRLSYKDSRKFGDSLLHQFTRH